MANCCIRCFDIQEIKDIIKTKRTKGNCEFCLSKSTFIADTKIVGNFLQKAINKKYINADENVPRDFEGDSAEGSTHNVFDILNNMEKIYSNIVLDPVALTDSLICSDVEFTTKKPTDSNNGGDDELKLWKLFCNEIKYKKRYITFDEFFKQLDDEFNIYNDFVKNLRKCIRTVKSGTILYRARINNKRDKYKNEDLTSAPMEEVKNNRMSPAGISFFYGSYSRDTCIAEINPNIGDIVSIGIFKLLKDIKIFDLSINPDISNIFNPSYDFYNDSFIKPFIVKFGKEISKPINKQSADLEYIPTQIFTEYIRFLPKYPFRGIKYHSSQRDKGKNIVLFEGPEISNKGGNRDSLLLDFIESENHKIKTIKYSFKKLIKVKAKKKLQAI